jgi:hypothetical protein
MSMLPPSGGLSADGRPPESDRNGKGARALGAECGKLAAL